MTDAEATLDEKFWKRVRKSDGCWEWTGWRSGKGYGKVHVSRNRSLVATRVSWQIAYGPIPDGLFVCHRCDNPGCVRPDHLFLGTAQDNQTDAKTKGRYPIGESNNRTKLTAEQVREIRAAHATGKTFWGANRLAQKFGVHKVTVSLIARGKWWNHQN